jgi:hypothetical protein
MLPIRQTINALPGLKRTEKAVLIEVCQLAENSEPAGWCTAKNDYLVQALGGTERTMSRTITALESRGLLLSKGQGKARKLGASPTLRACYAGADEATRRAAIATLNLDKSGHQPRQIEPTNLDNSSANLDKNSPEPRQNDEVEAAEPRQIGSTNLDKSGHQPRQNGSRVYGDQQYQQVTSTPPTPKEWESERAAFQKKIGELETENRQLKAKILELVPPVAATPQKPAPISPLRLTTYRDYDGAWPEQFAPLFDSEAYRTSWAQWGKYLDELGKPHRGHNHEKTDQAELGRMAAGSEARAIEIITLSISAGWKRLIDHKPEAGSGKPRFGQPPATPTQAAINIKNAAAQQRQTVIT